jgi:hypothetical protein
LFIAFFSKNFFRYRLFIKQQKKFEKRRQIRKTNKFLKAVMKEEVKDVKDDPMEGCSMSASKELKDPYDWISDDEDDAVVKLRPSV